MSVYLCVYNFLHFKFYFIWLLYFCQANSNACNTLISFITAVAFTGASLFVLQQFAGINGVLYFSSLTFQDAGITNGALASLFVGLTNFAGLTQIHFLSLFVCFFFIFLFCFFFKFFLKESTSNSLIWLLYLGALSALYLMDKQGRKRLLIGSYFGMVSKFLLART